MPKFSNKFKEPCFWPVLGPFSQFFGQKKFSWKIQLCHAQLHMGFQHHAKIQEKLMIQFKENAQTDRRMEGRKDGRTGPILQDPSGYCWGSNQHIPPKCIDRRCHLALFFFEMSNFKMYYFHYLKRPIRLIKFNFFLVKFTL